MGLKDRLGLRDLRNQPPGVGAHLGLHHDRRATNVQRSGRCRQLAAADPAEEVGLRLDGGRPRRTLGEIEEGADGSGTVGRGP